jgi:hypothetical protein
VTELPSHKARGVGNDRYGEARLSLALLVRAALEATDIPWFLDAGTLLGAYRNGKLIAHDDDFDIAVYFPVFRGEADLGELQRRIALPPPYDTRIVTRYGQKIEVFDSTSERFVLPPQYKGADFHTVTVDLQVMTDAPDGSVVYLHDLLQHVHVPADAVLPTAQIRCEGHLFDSPHDTPRFLQAQYGYLGTDARYDPKSKKYVKI